MWIENTETTHRTSSSSVSEVEDDAPEAAIPQLVVLIKADTQVGARGREWRAPDAGAQSIMQSPRCAGLC